MDDFSGFQIIDPGVVALDGLADRLRHHAVLRDIGKADLHQLLPVLLHKCRALQGGCEDFPVHALPGMVHDRVLERVSRRNFRMPRREAGPQL